MEWLGTACAVLGWRPGDFWKSTVAEFFAAIDGHNRASRAQSGLPEPVSRQEADEMFAKEERRVARLRAADGR